ncbi:hypothetical protein D3C76_745860 [compost metagenome]|jgi:hypothetical protein
MKSAENIQAIFDQCMAESTNLRQRRSLMTIHKACEYLANENVEITPGSVERYCIEHDLKGPKAQSIRNSPVLKRYLDLRKSGQVIKANTSASRPTPLIPDETLRAYVNLLIEERDQARADKARIVKGLRSIPGIPVDDLIRIGFDGVASTPSEPVRLSPILTEALTRLFDDHILSDCGLTMRQNRLVSALTRNVLFAKEHLDAIQKLLESGKLALAQLDSGAQGTELT